MYYEIEGTTVRLAGSMHLVPATAPNLPDWIWNAYDWSDELVFEADLASVRDHIYLKDGDSLHSKIPVPLWEALEAAWPPSHPLGAVGRLRLWMAILQLPTTRAPAAAGVELHLTQRARQDGKPISYLETIGEFAELGDGLPPAVLEEALSITLAELPNALRNLLDLHRAWLTRRMEEIELVIARGPLSRMPQVAARMLDLRNERWMPKIVDAIAVGRRTLIAAGALHFPRDQGLLNLL